MIKLWRYLKKCFEKKYKYFCFARQRINMRKNYNNFEGVKKKYLTGLI